MRIQELFDEESHFDVNQIRVLQHSCDQFISSTDEPLMKNLSGKGDDFLRLKIRFHKRKSDFISVFNEALSTKYNIPNLHQRSIFANGPKSFVPTHESYYIFPLNGFKFLYSHQVKSSNDEYRSVFEMLLEEYEGDEVQASSIIKDLMSYNYTSENLEEGIVEGCEIILYNIPYYYAVKTSAFPEYQELLNLLEK